MNLSLFGAAAAGPGKKHRAKKPHRGKPKRKA
jgi:hypothetical protein